MGKQRRVKVVVRDESTSANREEFKKCSTPGCRNVVATWSLPRGYVAPVICMSCTHLGRADERHRPEA